MTKDDNNENTFLTKDNIIRGSVTLVILLFAFGVGSIMSDISDVKDLVDGVDKQVGVVAGKVDSLKDIMNKNQGDNNLIHNNMMNDIDVLKSEVGEIKEQIK